MNILFDINHPAHVHLFRNAIKILKAKGHRVIITSRDKDVTLQLLNHYNLSHHILSNARKGLWGLGMELLVRQFRLLPILLKNRIQVCVSATGACSVHICKLLGIPTLVFYDTEHARLQNSLTVPFATQFITPDSFKRRLGKNHATYDSIHDLAYLHPHYFTPQPDTLKTLGLGDSEKYVVMRFVSWQAAHDIGQKGMSLSLKRDILNFCRRYGKVFIVSESPLPPEFEPYRYPLSVEKIHDVLTFAELYIGEGGSMATEAAVLGTPSIFISSLTAGVFEELEEKYGLMYCFTPDQEAAIFTEIENLLRQKNLKEIWAAKRKKVLDDKIDVTDFMVKMILQYANGHNPEIG